VRLCARDLELALVEVDAEDTPGGRPPGELERDVPAAGADVEAGCVLRNADAVEQRRRRRCEDPRDEAQSLASLVPTADDVGGVASHAHILHPGAAPMRAAGANRRREVD
jgi:hypothetical protein